MKPTDLPEDLLEYFKERAAIREIDGQQTRAEAEAGALAEALVKLQERRKLDVGR